MTTENAQASIITIGDELMIGQVIDTNSAWIAQELNKEGIWLRRRVAVGDNPEEMKLAFDEESAKSKIILITGGLGPTADDITKPFLCEYFGTTMVTDQGVLQHVQNLFENVFKRPFTELNRKQADVPAGCTVIHNSRGTAPGMMFEKNGVIYVSMPGVPHEMKGMMTDLVIPILRRKVFTGHILHRTLLTAGIGESFLAEHIASWQNALPPQFKLAYLPNSGMVRLRITGRSEDLEKLEAELTEQFTRLKALVKEWLVTDQDLTIPELVSGMLRDAGKTVGTAESCTGGYIAHLLTREAGASDIFNGTIVSYCNAVKTNLLHVDQAVLDSAGAVSEETVRQMAAGALFQLNTDYVIATSGIMGPAGGTDTKPVGLVWIACGDGSRIVTKQFQFRYNRIRNIEMTANNALNLLRRFMTGEL